MNKLDALEKLGFKISWKLVCLGLFGDAEIPPVLTRGEVIAYLTDSLIDVGGQIDDIVRLICEENEDLLTKAKKLLKPTEVPAEQ